MTTKRCHSLHDSRADDHLRWLNQLDSVCLADGCCDICYCDCYDMFDNDISLEDFVNSTCSSKSPDDIKPKHKKKKKTISKSYPAKSTTLPPIKHNNNHNVSQKVNKNKITNDVTTSTTDDLIKVPQSTLGKKFNGKQRRRSKSVCYQRDHTSDCFSDCCHYTRDCVILSELLNSLEVNGDGNEQETTLKQHIDNKGKTTTTTTTTPYTSTDSVNEDATKRTAKTELPFLWSEQQHLDKSVTNINKNNASPIRLSKSMANLCLLPTVREAYLKVPAHDKRILNRMATKRNEQAIAKESAWLARKYWENENYERELLKCEQMEEYKKAIHDKQFQDYLQTKARLDEIAQRDLHELQRLKASLREKEIRTDKHLHTLRRERANAITQKRYDEFFKTEAVNLQQEQNHLDDLIRKDDICQRLTERLQRADQIRNQMLENYLKRLRYDNYMEQLQHEELWRQVQTNQQLKREQLKADINRKRCKSQHFLQHRQQHMDAIRRRAKISQNLRELVRSSISPETGITLYGIGDLHNTTASAGNTSSSQTSLSKLLLPHSRTKYVCDKINVGN